MNYSEKTYYFSVLQIEVKTSSRVEERLILNAAASELSYQEFDVYGDVTVNYGINLTAEQMNEIKPYIDMAKFEPFQEGNCCDLEHSCGYYDEINVDFIGISDSPIAMIRLSMNQTHDIQHQLPTERLLNYLCGKYFSDKRFKGTFVYGVGNSHGNRKK